MIFTANTSQINKACSNVMRAVSVKGAIPTIEGILLQTGDNCLNLTGYDFEFGMHTSIEAQVQEPGAIVINAKMLCEIIKKLEAPTVTFEISGVSAMIKSGAAVYNVTGINASEYPELPSVSGGYPLFLDKNILRSMVEQTIYAVADDDNPIPVYKGIKFEVTKNTVRLIGVNGVHFAMRTENVKYDGSDLSFIVPKKTIKEVIKLIDDEGDDNVSISVGKRHIVFEINSYSVISRLLDGKFIDYNAVIPKTTKTTVLLNTSEAIRCIERMKPVIQEDRKNPVRCLFDGSEMRISTVSALGRVVDYMPVNCAGERIEIGFNSRYLLEALRAADTDQVKVELNSPVTAAKILPLNGDSFLFLVLPMRLKNEI